MKLKKGSIANQILELSRLVIYQPHKTYFKKF